MLYDYSFLKYLQSSSFSQDVIFGYGLIATNYCAQPFVLGQFGAVGLLIFDLIKIVFLHNEKYSFST